MFSGCWIDCYWGGVRLEAIVSNFVSHSCFIIFAIVLNADALAIGLIGRIISFKEIVSDSVVFGQLVLLICVWSR